MKFVDYFYFIILFLLVFVFACKKDSSIELDKINQNANTDTLATFLSKMEGKYKVKGDSVLWGPPSHSGSFDLGTDTISIIKSIGDTIMVEGHKLYYNIYSNASNYSFISVGYICTSCLYYTLDYYSGKDSIIYNIHYPSGLGGGVYSVYRGVRIK